MERPKIPNELPLCAPAPELACFGCCPPIRPPHYDPLDYVGSLRREFIENRKRYLSEGPSFKPIIGYHCWALGFLDAKGRRVGCLLHPSRNDGKDLRFLIDYGNKCGREYCPPARVFADLPREGQLFWTALVQGMNPFAFSSPKANPLFRILIWGPKVLEPLRAEAETNHWDAAGLLQNRPFLMNPEWNPKTHRYLFRLILQWNRLEDRQRAAEPSAEDVIREIWQRLSSLGLSKTIRGLDYHSVYTHMLPMEEEFLDFMRLGLGLHRIAPDDAIEIKARIDHLCREVMETT